MCQHGSRVRSANLASKYVKLFWAQTWSIGNGRGPKLCLYRHTMRLINKRCFMGSEQEERSSSRAYDILGKSNDGDSGVLNCLSRGEDTTSWYVVVSHHGITP